MLQVAGTHRGRHHRHTRKSSRLASAHSHLPPTSVVSAATRYFTTCWVIGASMLSPNLTTYSPLQSENLVSCMMCDPVVCFPRVGHSHTLPLCLILKPTIESAVGPSVQCEKWTFSMTWSSILHSDDDNRIAGRTHARIILSMYKCRSA